MPPRSLYRYPQLESVEDVEKYRPGGYHPINLYDILANKYKVIHKLGYGGFATVWLAQVLGEDRCVAIKVLVANACDGDLKCLAYLRDHSEKHPNIAYLQGVFQVKGPNGLHQCLVLDVAGPSLKQIATRHIHLPGLMARSAGQQIAKGLAHLHSLGICHGDLTDSNILFQLNKFDTWSEAQVYRQLGAPHMVQLRLWDDSIPGKYAPENIVQSIQYSNLDVGLLTGNIRIIDFGEFFFADNPPAGLLGTPVTFLAPEMRFGWRGSRASDIWALGCLIFELQSSRQLIYAFFGRFEEALGEIVQTLGPLPAAWRHTYFEKSREVYFQSGKKDPWFDFPDNLRHPLESLLDTITPPLTAKEITTLSALLREALAYEPKDRLTASQIAMHPWFTGCKSILDEVEE